MRFLGTVTVFVCLTLAAAVLSAKAQSWGRGGAFAGACPSQGYRGGHSCEPVKLNYKEPCWSAALSKCGRDASILQDNGDQDDKNLIRVRAHRCAAHIGRAGSNAEQHDATPLCQRQPDRVGD